MATRWLDAREDDAWRLYLRAHAELWAELNRRLGAAGLSITDYEILSRLSEAADQRLRIAELAETLHWERSRTSHQVSRMVRRGLVERQECEEDRRGAFAALSASGRSALEQAAPNHAADVRELFIGPIGGRLDDVVAVSRAMLDESSPPA